MTTQNVVEIFQAPPRKRKSLRNLPSEKDLSLSLNEDRIALRFADLNTEHLRYDHDIGTWYIWTGTHWCRDHQMRTFDRVRTLCRDFSARSQLDAEKKQLGKQATAAAVERMARADQRLATTSKVWDQDTFLLGTPAGTVDLRTGELRPSIPSEFITRLTSVAPANVAECPVWNQFLDDVTGGDGDLPAFLQAYAGYALTGDTREHSLMFICGPGGNGKSVYLNSLTKILGDYSTTAAMETFISSPRERHSTELAMLNGARLVTASETEEGQAWAESRIKQLTGGDKITARYMRQDNFTFQPQFKLVVVGNHKPVLRNVDAAMARRINIVPFEHQPQVIDRDLEAKLQAEYPGILRWMIDGCLAWQRGEMSRPTIVSEATEGYFSEQDTVQQWMEECCDAGEAHYIDTVQSLFLSWVVFAEARGEQKHTSKWLSNVLTRHGCRTLKNTPGNHGKRGFSGIRVKLSGSYGTLR